MLAGLSVAVMVIPQGMSYAQNLAYLPQVFGLYGSFIPCILYGILGSSRQLVVGPVAVTSLLLGSGLSNIFGNFQINPSDPGDALEAALQDRYNRAAIQVAFFAGLFYTLIGILRMGWIINFLSIPVVSGFMTGAAMIILTGQIKYITGQKLPRSDTMYDNLRLVFENLNLFKWREFVMGGSFIILLLVIRFLSKRYKKLKFLQVVGPLSVCIISIIIMNAAKLYVFNPEIIGTPWIKPVGYIPKGMPHVTVSWWFPLYDTQKELVLAVLVCLLDIVESTSIARSLAVKNKYKLDGTQELRGLGLANLGGAIFNSYTTTGSFSRSAVNNSVGAVTQLSGIITGFFIMLVLLVLTPVFQNMSANVQGAIVIVGVLSIFDFEEFFYTWRVSKFDCLCWTASFLITAFAGAEIGIGSAVGLSIVVFVLRTAFPKITNLGRLPGDADAYACTTLFSSAIPVPVEDGIIAIRPEAPLFFANTMFIRDDIESRIKRTRGDGHDVKVVIVSLQNATDVDATACHIIGDYQEELEREDVVLVIAEPTEAVLKLFQRAKLIEKVGLKNIHLSVAEALTRAYEITKPAGGTSDV